MWNLGYPAKLVFDETYYVKDALTLSLEGHEKNWPGDANLAFESGQVFDYLSEGAFVVHPPLGKWLIAAGMWLAGPQQSYGWRLSTALFGVATVALLMLVAKQLFGSNSMALISGFLMAIDGVAITLSRTALLDGTLTFFLLLGFYFLLLDQDRSRKAIALALNRGSNSLLVFRPWLIACGVTLGLASSIKWSALYLLAAIGIYLVISETLLRKASSESNWLSRGVLKQGVLSFLNLVPVAAISYTLSWLGWIVSTGGYGRDWAKANSPGFPINPFPEWLQALWNYQVAIYRFHVNLTTEHSYQAHPIGWLIGFRPTAFFYESTEFGNDCVSATGCSSAITALGNPAIWWAGTVAIGYLSYRYLRHRERLFGLTLLGLAALYLPWLIFSQRTVFHFYSISFLPFLVLSLVLAAGLLYQKLATSRPRLSLALVIGFLAIATALFLFFLPVNTGWIIPFDQWRLRMWFPSWI